MNLQTVRKGGSLCFVLSGEIDESSAPALRQEMDEALSGGGFREVVFDMSAGSFMDSTGIGLLLGRYKRGRGRGIPMKILNPNPVCDKIFVLSGIYQVMPKAEGVQEGRA